MGLGLGARQVQNTTAIWKKQGSNFTSQVILNFPQEYDVMCYIRFFTCLIFWSHLLSKWSEAATHNCARKVVFL